MISFHNYLLERFYLTKVVILIVAGTLVNIPYAKAQNFNYFDFANRFISCEDLKHKLPVVTIDSFSIYSDGIWSKPLTVKDDFTGELKGVAVFDRHWESSNLGLTKTYFLSFLTNNAIKAFVIFENSLYETRKITKLEISKTLEIKIDNKVYPITYDMSLNAFPINQELKEAFIKGNNISIRGTLLIDRSFIWPIGKETIKAYKEIQCY